MSPWIELNEKNIAEVVPTLGIFQLAKTDETVAYVGRADEDLRKSLTQFLGKGYSKFQWVQLPWVKEGFEMQCRLFHFAGGPRKLDNEEHPNAPEGHFWPCTLSLKSPATCDL